MYQVVCPSQPTLDAYGQPQCSEGWQIEEATMTVFHQIVNLLTFDLETFSYLLGVSILLFITGYGIGIANRTMNRI